MALEKDEELIAAVLAGQVEKYEVLVKRYQGRVVNYLYRLLRSLDDAHDMAQEVFLRVYRALDRYNPEYRFSTWLFRVAQNAAIDSVRKRRIQTVSMERRENQEGESSSFDFPSHDPSPYGDLRNTERGSAIGDAIDGLPAEYRELIQLRHFGELSYGEIADLKEMPLGTVKNKLFRGRQMLKEKLADYLTD
ncbi:MAG: sigma-70 family RNA polymerase sigma factor [Acidobacteriota bacterium]|nr:sigma-70 family RNA polymerase sigma factor [Acidobacteriota bacterium]